MLEGGKITWKGTCAQAEALQEQCLNPAPRRLVGRTGSALGRADTGTWVTADTGRGAGCLIQDTRGWESQHHRQRARPHRRQPFRPALPESSPSWSPVCSSPPAEPTGEVYLYLTAVSGGSEVTPSRRVLSGWHASPKRVLTAWLPEPLPPPLTPRGPVLSHNKTEKVAGWGLGGGRM